METVAKTREFERPQPHPLAVSMIFVALCIAACLGALIVKTVSNAHVKEEALSNKIKSESTLLQKMDQFSAYMDGEYRKMTESLVVKQDDLYRFSNSEYNNVHVSMWDIGMLNTEWYEAYYGTITQYGYYSIETPQELKEYLTSCLSSKNTIDHVYLNVDPFMLKENYYKTTYYDEEVTTYEEYLEDELFSLIDKNENISFDFFLPIMSASYLAKLDSEKFEEIYSYWYTFMMYLRWYSNATVSFAGDEEWLIVNDDLYTDENTLIEDAAKKVYVYLYSGEYELTPPELKVAKDKLYGIIVNAN